MEDTNNVIYFHRKLQKAEEQIELLSDGLDSVEKNVSELREQLNVNTKEAAEIELNINKEKKTIEAAQKLVEKLDDEFSRWGLQVFLDLTSQSLLYIIYNICWVFMTKHYIIIILCVTSSDFFYQNYIHYFHYNQNYLDHILNTI